MGFFFVKALHKLENQCLGYSELNVYMYVLTYLYIFLEIGLKAFKLFIFSLRIRIMF